MTKALNKDVCLECGLPIRGEHLLCGKCLIEIAALTDTERCEGVGWLLSRRQLVTVLRRIYEHAAKRWAR